MKRSYGTASLSFRSLSWVQMATAILPSRFDFSKCFAALAGSGVESFQPFLFQPREKGGAGHVVRKLAEIHGGGFHGEREAAEQPHELARRVAFRLAAETSVGLVALDERE